MTRPHSRRRSRSTSTAASSAACPFGGDRQRHLPGPRRARSYAQDLLSTLDVEAIRERGFRIVVDYGYSASSFVLPLAARPARDRGGLRARVHHRLGRDRGVAAESIGAGEAARRQRSAPTSGPSSTGPASACSSSTSRAARSGDEQTLLLFLRLLGEAAGRRNGRRCRSRSRAASRSSPRRVGLEVVRTPAAPAELLQAATQDGVVFAGALGGVYIFPEFLPGYDAVASLCKLLELLAPESSSRSPSSSPSCPPRPSSTASSPARGRSRGSSCAC